MKIKAERMAELEKFGFIPCLGEIYTRKRIAIWSDGKILKCNRNGDISYHKPYNHRFAVRDLIAAGMVEDGQRPKE